MSERSKILGRIRKALTQRGAIPGLPVSGLPVPGLPHGTSHPVISAEEAVGHISEWLPAVGDSFDDRIELFQQNSVDLKTDFRLVGSQQELIEQIAEMASSWQKIATHRGELSDSICSQLELPICLTDEGYEPTELEACDVGMTQCDALIAQTGSVLVTARSAGGRALSVLPPHHIVLARRDQLLPDLPAAFALLEQRYGADFPSFISLITGPSRTGDIERILVLGAHGPKQLTVFCL